ncbi:hypothetical protein HS1genome_0643 [Sulfodiicoccus acidiphilus]|uniref:acylphosphatase n=1 Tax=Sulfodiicoccus acidiphilus TaxID=1670455 RepID=A0A348B252_9CREN|nr:acylphosphatase [Sulfodiicoccus acidiphilus]BBD72254.1 hypothetical protein HS1genome_0643 [Sulfodiicoccus acidiphilus]GGT90755.1 hypothetical protein GCM10007116_05770 [Sulfodiicoccus acidiphilus]
MRAKRVVLKGEVQGIGFRAWLARRARALGLLGYVENVGKDVVIVASGNVEPLIDAARRYEYASVREVEVEDLEVRSLPPFTVKFSEYELS